jgi:hypothetical protein
MPRLTDLAQTVAPIFGVPRLELGIEGSDVRRLMATSAVPTALLVVVLVELLIRITLPDLRTYPYRGWDDWSLRIARAARDTIEFGAPLATAWLFASGLTGTNRRLGSWSALISVVCALVTLGSGSFVAFVYLDTNAPFFIVNRFYADVWSDLARVAGFLAIGYAFLAYRGLNASGHSRRVYGRRRRSLTP